MAYHFYRKLFVAWGVMMGSKMASASRVIQIVKPHIPLIRFPDRRDNPKPSVAKALRSAGPPSHSSAISRHSGKVNLQGSKSPDLLMYQGPPDTAEIIKTLPRKYRRKLLSQEEIEFIQCGDPE
ncbi:28S ribosomal protein S36, mitochondrial-like [Lemur catta]|uniref:28S ribosomal protein S36, mitochondrial-like n=1 Tax=Lemur catta TaxID=9447 RepID=UPI001E269289|nr:28S ribosomal protein S36, mitochondrial-like [Lemur catta]